MCLNVTNMNKDFVFIRQVEMAWWILHNIVLKFHLVLIFSAQIYILILYFPLKVFIDIELFIILIDFLEIKTWSFSLHHLVEVILKFLSLQQVLLKFIDINWWGLFNILHISHDIFVIMPNIETLSSNLTSVYIFPNHGFLHFIMPFNQFIFTIDWVMNISI